MRPRDYTVHGENRPFRVSKGSRHKHRMRTVKPSRAPDEEEQEIIPGEPDRTGEAERVLRVKQIVKMVMLAQGPKSKSQLERSFRMADKDGSGELDFDELNFSLRNDFQIKGMTRGDVTRIFENMDADKSGRLSTTEFVNAIESVPFPELKNQVGYQTLPTPHSLKTRQSFQVWPTTVDLGVFQYRNRETKRVELTVRNVGYAELRFRVHIYQLEEGQSATIIEKVEKKRENLKKKIISVLMC
jgi:Ca2+-binding EF-hand superfamily protein